MDDGEFISISLLSHVSYCPRRAALILNERVWLESTDTAKGRYEHERVHDARAEKRGDNIKLYEYTVYSDKLMLTGKCDCIEAVSDKTGCIIPAAGFPVSLYPVEYKHGKVRDEAEYNIQLCAQALCLEEMFGTSISEGAIYYISSHKRFAVALDSDLRTQTLTAIDKIRNIRKSMSIPKAETGPKCQKCSFREYCMPEIKASAANYCKMLKKEAEENEKI